ncbi:hypothetical protein AB0D62_35990 [Streptomyces massasporeus]|uniref:hypothetical protein n=1 Tax=Streptomyces massasporeus TaxID=67324 RepID=UPI0033D6446F
MVSLLVVGLRDGLVMASPGGPVQDVLAVADGWPQHEGSQEPYEFGAAHQDERLFVLVDVVDGGGDYGDQ